MPNSQRPHGLQPTRLLHPWDFPGKSAGVGCHCLLQGIFPTQELNPGPPHCRQMLYHLSHQGSPRILEWVAFPTPGELPDLEIEPWSPALQADSLPAELPFLSTRASIRQEKKELNMLMLPPLLGDIWVCIQSIAPSEGLMPARFPLDNIFPKERSGPPVASNCCLFFKKMLILKLIFIEHLLCAWRFSKLFTWMNLHNSLKNM